MANKSIIPFIALDRQYQNLKKEIIEVSDLVYSSGKVLDGQYASAFEEAIAQRTNRKYAITTNSCSMAMLICYVFFAQEQKRKKVAAPAYSFIATSNAIDLAGMTGTYVDVDGSGLIDLDHLDVPRDQVEVISYVNLFGNVIDYNKLKVISSFFHDLTVLEDAAQSFGASFKGIPSGKLGFASLLSFDPTKNLPNFGSGGMILTDSEELDWYARNFKDNGKSSGLMVPGTNSKMSEVDCAQMLVKLNHFDAWQERRAKIANFYTECLHGVFAECPVANPDVVHAWHKYVIQLVDRDALKAYLDDAGIETKIHYPYVLPKLRTCPNAARLSDCSLSLPIYPEMTDSEVETVVAHIQKFFKSYTNP